MKCEVIYELWEYKIWRRGGDDMHQVLAGNDKSKVAGEKG